LQTKRNPIRVIIADDHALVREGLIALLEREAEIKVVAEVERADDLKAALTKTPCDVLLLDLRMDRWVVNDIDSLARITKVMVLTASDRLEDLVAAFHMGARAIVRKTSAVDTVVQAIQAVANGMIWLPPGLQKRLFAQSALEEQPLTKRESEIVRQVAVGLRNAEVAEKLSITEGTVKIHLNNIFQKLGVRDRVELTLYAIRTRLIRVSERRR
jgi:two-component system NarL family response regulator